MRRSGPAWACWGLLLLAGCEGGGATGSADVPILGEWRLVEGGCRMEGWTFKPGAMVMHAGRVGPHAGSDSEYRVSYTPEGPNRVRVTTESGEEYFSLVDAEHLILDSAPECRYRRAG